MSDETDFNQLLACVTPQAWLDTAASNQDLLLIDHANCEKKAAATAFKLIFRYGERHPELQEPLSRLAREELRHFEQVMRVMKKRGINYRMLSASRYAVGLRQHARRHEPERMVDLLIISAFIEARSCERFHSLAPHLDAELAGFYAGLAAAEARHFELYMKFTERAEMNGHAARISEFATLEASLISRPDREFRFHSGPPA